MDKPIYNLELENTGHGVATISVVAAPAIDEEFVALSKHLKESEVTLKLQANVDDKQELVGAVMIPEILIYRNKPDEHYVKFSKETIKAVVERFAQRSDNWSVNFGHDSENVGDVVITESWIVEDAQHDKSNIYKLSVPEGSWVIKMKVNDPEKWKEIRELELYNGFSLEGVFSRKLEENTEEVTQTMAEEVKEPTELVLEEQEAPKEETKEEVKAEETPKEEETPAEEPKEETKEEVLEETKEVKEEAKTYTEEEVAVMIADALKAAKDAETKVEAEEEIKASEEEEVDTIMNTQTSAMSDKMTGALEYFNKLKNQ